MGILYSPIPFVADVLTLKSSIRNVLGFFLRGGARAPNAPSPSPGYGLGNSSPILPLHKVHILSFLAIVCNLPVPMGNFIFERLNFDKLILFLSANLGK